MDRKNKLKETVLDYAVKYAMPIPTFTALTAPPPMLVCARSALLSRSAARFCTRHCRYEHTKLKVKYEGLLNK